VSASEHVLILEDRGESRDFLASIVRQTFPHVTVHGATDLRSARKLVAEHPALRFALIDLGLPDGSGIELIRELQASHPETPSIVTTVYSDDDSLFAAIAAGAQGYLLKGQPEALLRTHLTQLGQGLLPLSPSVARRMLEHFRARELAVVDAEDVALSPRETEVLTYIGRGLRVSEVARLLGLAESTVAGYVKVLYRKLNISSRAEAALEAVKRGLA
jgi:DNA-binding NarL/FixJ family response regulator